MIWVDGQILPDDGLTINAADRTFEHGLGLFETLRTWGGRPTLLDAHKARMLRSAEELKLPIDPSSLPDAEAVRILLEAEGVDGDRMLRITATGGTGGTGGTAETRSIVWMRSSPLPPSKEGGAVVCTSAWSLPIYPRAGEDAQVRRGAPCPVAWGEDGEIGPFDPPNSFTARHKTLNYWSRRIAFEQVRNLGFDEILFVDDRKGLTEGSRSNLFLVVEDELVTITTDAPIVPGIMRGLVLDVASELPIESKEVWNLGLDRLFAASEVFLTNAVRGIVPVVRVEGPYNPIIRPGERSEWPAPGPWTIRLQESIARRLWPDRGTTP
jgi:branched-subunit amino acid aminotransferase/4-amino-4-deoxychorismate lyase